jgi:hypothetical protein
MKSINTQGNFSSYRSASTQNQAPSEQAPQYQQGQFALNQNELNAIHALTAAGVVSTALLNPNAIAELNTSSLWGPLSFLQGNSIWADQDRSLQYLYNKNNKIRNWSDVQKHQVMHYAQNGDLGRNIVAETGFKDGGTITDAKGKALVPPKASPKWWNPLSWGNKNPEIQISAASQRALEQGATGANGVNTAGKQALFKAELHTPNHMYNLNAKSQWNLNPFSREMHGRKYGDKVFGRYENSGTSGDALLAQGSTGRVTQAALEHGKQLEKIDKLKAKLKNTTDLARRADLKSQIRRETKKAGDMYRAFDTVRLQQASNDLLHKQRIVDLDTKMLDDLNKKHPHPTGKVAEQIQALKKRLTQNQQLLNDQKLHFDKLNRLNADSLKGYTAQNLDDIAGKITNTKPNWFQKIANFNIFKPHENLTEKATKMLLENDLKDLGLSKDQLQKVQTAMAQGDDAVQNALTKIMAENRAMADKIAEGIQASTTATEGVGLKAPSAEAVTKNTKDLIQAGGEAITQNADDALDATLQAKHASSVGRNAVGMGAIFTKWLAIVGTALEILNFGNNMKNGDHRKAATDLTTSVVAGGVGLLAGAKLAAIGIAGFPALLAVGVVGMGVSMLAAPVIDKVIKKTTGLTNKGERDAAKAEQDKARPQTLLAN